MARLYLAAALAILLGWPAPASAQLWSGVLAPVRATDWAGIGVSGGIPSATWADCNNTACNNLAPGGSGSVTAATIVAALSGAQVNNVACSAALPCVVRLRAGSFLVGGFQFSQSNRVLRGAGAASTKLTFTSAAGSSCGESRPNAIAFCNGSSIPARGAGATDNTASLSGTFTQGQTTLTFSNTANLAIGRTVWLDQLNDSADFPGTGDLFICDDGVSSCSTQGWGTGYYRLNRSQVQGVIVTAINGSAVTFTPGLMMPNWRSGQSPGAWWQNNVLQNSGIENMTLDVSTTSVLVGIKGVNVTNVWVKGVRSVRTSTGGGDWFHVQLVEAMQCTVKDNYFWGPTTTGIIKYTYTPQIGTRLLFENNIIHNVVSAIAPNDPESGSVYGYNYVNGILFAAAIQTHNPQSLMNLYEGNNVENFIGDIIHGPHYMETLYRNHFDGPGNQVNENGGIVMLTRNRFMNLVGNVIGQSHFTIYQQNCQTESCSAGVTGAGNAAFVLGAGGSGSGPGSPMPPDTHVGRTVMRWGNWNNVTSTNSTGSNDTSGTRWCIAPLPSNCGPNAGGTGTGFVEVPSAITNFPSSPVPASQTLVPSWYLSAQPGWWATAFGTPGWPAIGPDVVASGTAAAPNVAATPTGGHAYKIPARLCFENTADDLSFGVSPPVKLFDAAACYGVGGGTPPAAPTGLKIVP